jgi:hypothetical protein
MRCNYASAPNLSSANGLGLAAGGPDGRRLGATYGGGTRPTGEIGRQEIAATSKLPFAACVAVLLLAFRIVQLSSAEYRSIAQALDRSDAHRHNELLEYTNKHHD